MSLFWILQDTSQPIMCAYKLVTCEFKWFGLQGTVEGRIQKAYPRLFRNFHRQVFCWMDQWYGLTIEDIRRLEEETKKELDEVCCNGRSCFMVWVWVQCWMDARKKICTASLMKNGTLVIHCYLYSTFNFIILQVHLYMCCRH